MQGRGILEKIVHTQLIDYLNDFQIPEALQFGFKPFHSTETALIKVKYVFLVLLDMTADLTQCNMTC